MNVIIIAKAKVMDYSHYSHCFSHITAVKPPNRGHFGDGPFCPL